MMPEGRARELLDRVLSALHYDPRMTAAIDAIVAQAVEAAVSAERERCAKIAESGGCDAPWNGRDQEERDKIDFTAKRIAAALRADAEGGHE